VGVAAAPKKKYLVAMNNFKNLLIAILTGLLALTLFTQPAQSAGTSTNAKIQEYAHCLALYRQHEVAMQNTYQSAVEDTISFCRKYRP
jgi:hypothetical protein